MNPETQVLLGLQPRHALVRMINTENQSRYRYDQFSFGTPVAVSRRRTQLPFRVNPSPSFAPFDPKTGQAVFTYLRLELGEVFGSILEGFRPSLPTSTDVILKELTARTGVIFEQDDVLDEDISAQKARSYVLRANPKSLRWVGELALTLIDGLDLSTVVARKLTQPTALLDDSPLCVDQSTLWPTANASAYRSLVNLLDSQVPAEAQPVLAELLPKVFDDRVLKLDLTGAVVFPPKSQSAWYNPNVDQMVQVSLTQPDGLGLTDPTLKIPYTTLAATMTSVPRLVVSGINAIADGTRHRRILNQLKVPTLLDSRILPGELDLGPAGKWSTTPTPGPASLHQAIVQYNGPIRASIESPANSALDRVMIVTLDERFNTAYRGNYPIFYQSELSMNLQLPAASWNASYHHAFNPVGGTAPYTLVLVGGSLAPGHVFENPLATLTGVSTEVGSYQFTVEVRDSAGLVVRFDGQYTVQVLPLQFSITWPTVLVSGQSVQIPVDIHGGKTPYALLARDPLPAGIEIDGLSLKGTTPGAGLYVLKLAVLDAAGTTVEQTVLMKVQS